MKVICVVDSIDEINKKIDCIKNKFGNNIIFVVNAKLENIFKTYNYTINAVYNKNIGRVIHTLLSATELNDVVIYYTSLSITNELWNKFIASIGDGSRIVNITPKYSFWERLFLAPYNEYVKILFKTKDALNSKKLQFLPKLFVQELLMTHISNRLFEINENMVINIFVEDKSMSKSLKHTKKYNPKYLIPEIIGLVILIGLVLGIKFTSMKYWLVLIIILSCILDFLAYYMIRFKDYFDNRFFR